jgi:hypothetical protein
MSVVRGQWSVVKTIDDWTCDNKPMWNVFTTDN